MKRRVVGLLLPLACVLPGCPTNRSGQGRGAFLAVGTSLDPSALLGINEVVAIRFNKTVDPESLGDNARIFASESVTPAMGRFVVTGTEVRFLPRLPTRSDLSDAGFQPDTHYTICVMAEGTVCAPGLPPGGAPLRSRSGKGLARPFQATFRTLPGPVPFRDPVHGPPAVIALIPQAGSIDVPAGSSQDPTVVRAIWTEPLTPASVTVSSIGLYRRGDGLAVPVTVSLEQEVSGPVHVVLRPRSSLPCGSDLEVRWTSGIADLVGERAATPGVFPGFRTVACTGPLAIVEAFETAEFRDPAPSLPFTIPWQGAAWDVADSGVLRGGYGFGGSGRNGPLVVGAGTTFDLQASLPDENGVYEFESVHVAGTLMTTSSNPARILSLGDVVVEGTIDLDGGAGQPGPAMNTAAPVAGGNGRGGGANGGTANPFPGTLTVPIDARGHPRAGLGAGYGGNDSHIATAHPTPERVGCGGGGASHGGLGFNGNVDCSNVTQSGSQRGSFYGDSAITVLQGGSGGGGGGNAALIAIPPVPFPNRMSHAGGGGGAGGGALSIESVGTFTLLGSGRIQMNGGSGGVGGGPPPGKGGDGGGGSGGAFKVQAMQIVLNDPGIVRALGGAGSPGPSMAGMGGMGRVRLEDFDGRIGGTNSVQPTPSVAIYEAPGNGRTVAQSLWYDTSVLDPSFAFDGTDPQTGFATGSTMDLRFALPPGTGQTVRITFQGAPADPMLPFQPDPNATRWFPPQPAPQIAVSFATDLATLSGRGLRFLRFRIELDVGRVQLGQPLPALVAIDRLQVRMQ